jgi:hypothetical protein
MSDVLAPGTLVQMRTLRRFSHYMAGEIIAVPYEAARDLDAKRLAAPLAMMVPAPRPEAAPEGDPAAAPAPRAQPAGTVRK